MSVLTTTTLTHLAAMGAPTIDLVRDQVRVHAETPALAGTFVAVTLHRSPTCRDEPTVPIPAQWWEPDANELELHACWACGHDWPLDHDLRRILAAQVQAEGLLDECERKLATGPDAATAAAFTLGWARTLTFEGLLAGRGPQVEPAEPAHAAWVGANAATLLRREQDLVEGVRIALGLDGPARLHHVQGLTAQMDPMGSDWYDPRLAASHVVHTGVADMSEWGLVIRRDGAEPQQGMRDLGPVMPGDGPHVWAAYSAVFTNAYAAADHLPMNAECREMLATARAIVTDTRAER